MFINTLSCAADSFNSFEYKEVVFILDTYAPFSSIYTRVHGFSLLAFEALYCHVLGMDNLLFGEGV